MLRNIGVFVFMASLFASPAMSANTGEPEGQPKAQNVKERFIESYKALSSGPWVNIGNASYNIFYVLYSLSDPQAKELLKLTQSLSDQAEFRWIAFRAEGENGNAAAWMAHSRDRKSLEHLLSGGARAPDLSEYQELQRAYNDVQNLVVDQFFGNLYAYSGTDGPWSPVIAYKTASGKIRIYRGKPSRKELLDMISEATW